LTFLNARDAEEIRKHAEAILKIVGRSQVPSEASNSWRDEPATYKQRALLTKYGVRFSEAITKGEASDKINTLFQGERRAKK